MLARRVSKTPGEVVAFLASRQIAVDDSANGRLEEAHVRLVLGEFAPEELASRSVPEIDQPDHMEVASVDTSEPQEVAPEKSEADPGTPMDESPRLPDVIKAPKVELPGLKVIGKIELPEPRKKEIGGTQENSNADGAPIERPERPRFDKSRQQRKDRSAPSRKNPVALRREREAREAEEKRAQDLDALKKKKTDYYLNRVKKMHQPTKAARLVEEATETMTDTRPQPTTVMGRLWRWLTS